MYVDDVVGEFFKTLRNPVLDWFAIFVHYGLYFSVVIAFVLVMYVVKKRKESFMLLNAILFNTFFVYIIKQIVRRIRPDVLFNLLFMDRFSFPSGHTSIAFVIATTMSHYSRKHNKILLFILAVLVGFSRIYLNAHYFTDVLFGALFGVFTSLFIGKYEGVILKWERKVSKKMKSFLK
ncbi:MAG: phosphatase PAP2 family protein [Candidatus Nanoarchaeia archaeon]|nr:phosphatase PAP2 family protein [Candidatus Nanoarchaeia archaeon]